MTSRPSTAAPILAVLAVGFLLLPAIYVLGLGPTAWLVQNGYISDDSARTLYWPLQALADSDRLPWLNSILLDYVLLWIDQ